MRSITGCGDCGACALAAGEKATTQASSVPNNAVLDLKLTAQPSLFIAVDDPAMDQGGNGLARKVPAVKW